MGFFYKNGDIVKDGDVAFYTEFDGENWGYNYANGLHEIFMHEGKLCSRCIIFTQNNGATFSIINDVPVELKHCTSFSKGTELTHHYKVDGKYRDNIDMFQEHFTTRNRESFINIFNTLNR